MSVYNAVEEIDNAIRRYPWLDFELAQFQRGVLSVIGSVDPSSQCDIEILFEDIAFVSLPLTWHTDTSKQVFSILQDASRVVINQTFRVERGNYIFQFVPEDYPPDFCCLVGARAVSYRLTKES